MVRSPIPLVLGGLLLCEASLVGQDRATRKKVSPNYPELGRKMGVGGTVKLELNVDSEGQVQDAKVVQGHAFLREAAVSAAKQWTFVKAPAKSTEMIEVVFRQ